MVDPAGVNVILVPALLLLIGVVVYKKVIEPKRGQAKPASETKSNAKAWRKGEPKRQEVAKAKAASSNRMGSVL